MRRLLTLIAGLLITFSAIAEEPATFTLTTNAFLDTGPVPVLYTCDDKDLSPQLDWRHLPANTKSLALLLVDTNAPNGDFYHWVIYNIPTNLNTLPEGTNKLPTGSLAGKNSWGKLQYNGPCPPRGAAHTYVFTLYALDSKLSLPAAADAKSVLSAMEKHIVGKATLTMIYSRWLQ